MDLQSFQLYDDADNVNTTATPTFLAYKTRSGTVLTPPDITHRGDGIYEFSPPDSDLSLGVAWLTDNGVGSFPPHYCGSICQTSDPFATMLFVDVNGNLVDISGTPPTVAAYKNRAGIVSTPPALVNVYNGVLWTLTPSPTDATNGILYDVSAPVGSLPMHYSGNLIIDTVPMYVVPPSVPLGSASIDYEGLFAVFAAKRGTSAILSYQEWLLRFK